MEGYSNVTPNPTVIYLNPLVFVSQITWVFTQGELLSMTFEVRSETNLSVSHTVTGV